MPPDVTPAKQVEMPRLREAPAARYSADDVREGILHGLYAGRFAPGQKLIEADLVAAFGRPRSYVRDALLRLEGEGIVETVPFRGAYVRAYSPEQARDIDLTFAALLALAARQAAERIDLADHRARLVEAFGALKVFDPARGLYDYAITRERFYRLIIAVSGNDEIARICPIMQTHIVRVQSGRPLGEAEHRSRLAHYQTVFDAIMAGDPVGAERAVWESIAHLSLRTWAPAQEPE